MVKAAALLFMTVVAVCESACAAGNDLFIGQVVVEDARATPRSRHALHYRIDHDDPEFLASQLAGWIAAPGHNGDGVSFSLDAYPVTRTPVADDSHLDSSFVIDYTEPSIQELRDQIASRYGAHPSPGELEQFVYEYIEDKNVARGFDVASIVAQSRAGDCTEHAVLLTALLRMYGYPARTVMGIFVSLQEPVMGYGHAWAEYRGDAGWIGIDGTRIDDSVGAHYIPLGVIRDESIAYRMAVVGVLHSLSIDRITVE
ncbi:MAG: transglutaminase-like domain-containing protein [Pseudomonadota bacterium]